MLTVFYKQSATFFLLSLICILTLASCAGRNAETRQQVDDSRPYEQFVEALRSDTNSTVITLERTACFGACPIYFIAIHANGRVVYRGHEYVKIKGLMYDQISADTIKHLLKEFITAGYFSLAEKYESKKDTLANGEIVETNVTDLPTTITSVKFAGQFKMVQNYFGAPAWLRIFENKIDEVAKSARWIKNE